MNNIKWGIVLCFLLVLGAPIFAIRVQIPKPEYEVSGANSNQSFFVFNDSTDVKAVEITVFKRSNDIHGQEIQEEVENAFELYPSQLLLKPNQEQVVTMKYIGDPTIKAEEAYRVVVQELPVNLEKPTIQGNQRKSNLNILLKFVKSIYVVPAGVSPKIELVSFKPIEKNKKNFLEVIIKNTGTQHFILKSLDIYVQSDVDSSKKVTISVPSKDFPGYNLLVGDTRRLELPWPKQVPVGGVKLAIKVQ